ILKIPFKQQFIYFEFSGCDSALVPGRGGDLPGCSVHHVRPLAALRPHCRRLRPPALPPLPRPHRTSPSPTPSSPTSTLTTPPSTLPPQAPLPSAASSTASPAVGSARSPAPLRCSAAAFCRGARPPSTPPQPATASLLCRHAPPQRSPTACICACPSSFRHSPPSLPVGIELAPSLSLSAVTAELRSAAVVAPDHLPPRRRHLRLHRIPGDLVHPSRAAAFLRSGRRSRRRRRTGVSRGPPIRFPLPSPLSAAAPPCLWPPPATIGARARRLPSAVPAWPPSGAPRGCRVGPGCQPPAPLGAADAWDPRRRPVRARVRPVHRGPWGCHVGPTPVDPVRAPLPSADAINPF
ncbi:Os09g0302233, partial [Oryza sativa Japonica Group]